MDFSSLTNKAIQLHLLLKEAIAANEDAKTDHYAGEYEACIDTILEHQPQSMHELIEKCEFIQTHLLTETADNQQIHKYLSYIIHDIKTISNKTDP